MAAIINTNIQSLNAQRNLSVSQNSLATSMQRLSSGLRINSAKDDAAGLAISERMTTQIRGLNQAGRNANDGISLAQTAEGALGTIGNNLQRIRELAVQSRNATNSTEDRAALQKEVAQLKNEVDRVARDTSFNGTNLLDGSFTAKAFQVGANQGQLINIDSIQNSRVSQLGQWTSVDQPAKLVSASMGGTEDPGDTGSITFGTATYDATEVIGKIAGFTLNIGGKELKVDGLDAAASRTNTQVQAAFADNVKAAIDGAGFAGLTTTSTSGVVTFSNASLNTYSISTTNDNAKLPVANVGVGAGSNHAAITGSALQINGKDIRVDAAYSDSGRANQLAAAINTAFAADGSVKASTENGRLVLTSAADIMVNATPTAGTGLTGSTTVPAAKVVGGTAQTGFKEVSVATAEGADDTIKAMDAALKAVNSARADLGAIQNRFESVVSNLAVNSENLSASRSRIMDADFAQETANLSRSQILQQAGTAMVAQANQLPQNVLKLLQ